MHQLILTILALALIAGAAVVTVNYLPGWAPVMIETHDLVRDGVKTLTQAYWLKVDADGGIPPAVDTSRQDGGLAPNFSAYYSFLPRTPKGYAWTYGYTSEAQLLADGYTGDPTGGLYWFCLYPASAEAPEAVWRGIRRAQQNYPETQVYVNALGASACGRPFNSEPTSFPAPVTMTVFVRYIPGNP